jgi:hypothetical protein
MFPVVDEISHRYTHPMLHIREALIYSLADNAYTPPHFRDSIGAALEAKHPPTFASARHRKSTSTSLMFDLSRCQELPLAGHLRFA